MLHGLQKVDWLGLALFLPSAVAVLLPLVLGGVFFAWASWPALLPLLLGCSGLALLAVHQRRWAPQPMFRASLFASRAAACTFANQAVYGMCLNMVFYYLVLFWSAVRGRDALGAGVALLPEAVGIPAAAIVAGLVIRRTGDVRWPLRASWALTAAAAGLLWLQDAAAPAAALYAINTVVGLGCGTVTAASTTALLVTTVRRDHAHALAMGALFRSAGMALGIALGTAVFSARLGARLAHLGLPPDVVGPDALLRRLHELRARPDVVQAVVDTLRVLWITCCALAAVAAALCWLGTYPNIRDTEQQQQQQQHGLELAQLRIEEGFATEAARAPAASVAAAAVDAGTAAPTTTTHDHQRYHPQSAETLVAEVAVDGGPRPAAAAGPSPSQRDTTIAVT